MLPGEPLIYGKHLYKALPFDPERDFEPITTLFLLTQVLVVNASLSVNSLDELARLVEGTSGHVELHRAGLVAGAVHGGLQTALGRGPGPGAVQRRRRPGQRPVVRSDTRSRSSGWET